MNYTVSEYPNYDPTEILPLYESVGWSNYTLRPAMVEKAYAHSLLILGAYAEKQLVGILRAVGDGASVVFVQDILVHPDHQRKGIGTMLIGNLLERFPDVYQISLMTDDTPKTVGFYKSLGFTRLDEMGCCALMLHRSAQ